METLQAYYSQNNEFFFLRDTYWVKDRHKADFFFNDNMAEKAVVKAKRYMPKDLAEKVIICFSGEHD